MAFLENVAGNRDERERRTVVRLGMKSSDEMEADYQNPAPKPTGQVPDQDELSRWRFRSPLNRPETGFYCILPRVGLVFLSCPTKKG